LTVVPEFGSQTAARISLSLHGGAVAGARGRAIGDAEHLQGGAEHQEAGEHAVQRAAERGRGRGLRGGGRGAVAGAAAGGQPPMRPLVRAAPGLRRHLLLQVHRRPRRELVFLDRTPQPPPRSTRRYTSSLVLFFA